jgi:hypothetical protein
MSTNHGRRGARSLAAIALAGALVAIPATAAHAEGWRNFHNTSCGSAKAQTQSWSNGRTEHFQRTIGGTEWRTGWDNGDWPVERKHSFGLSTLSFAQVWTVGLLVRGDIACV